MINGWWSTENTVRCRVCGEPGYAHRKQIGIHNSWIDFWYHSDPMVCAENIERRRRVEEGRMTTLRAEVGSAILAILGVST